MIDPDICRIIAIDAHRRRTGDCPALIYSLGTGESFEIEPNSQGFVDLHSGLVAAPNDAGIVLPGRGMEIEIRFTGDVTFAGFDHNSGEAFSGRAGGGTTVTVYDAAGIDFFQYAIGRVKPANISRAGADANSRGYDGNTFSTR